MRIRALLFGQFALKRYAMRRLLLATILLFMIMALCNLDAAVNTSVN